ncbi:glycoside hydrolase superfamily [Xylariaceae sp. FL0804]|nr:glycoside hydrolase superfamily [Xylariaceae sp. FL0804]
MRHTAAAVLGLLAAALPRGVLGQNCTNATAIYKNPHAPVESRVADLLSRMTVEEKTAQLVQGDVRNWLDTTDGSINATGLAWSMQTRAGQFYVGIPVPWAMLSDAIRVGQEYLVRNTTLGIPAFVQSEGIHGFLIQNATIFNSPIGHACSFNPDLVARMAGAIAQEGRALGVNTIFAPLADLARELRYGRVEETLGEDPYLTGEMAYAYVKGLQAGNVSSTVKHFVAYASPENGINTSPVRGGERELRTTFLPPFKRAIMDGGARSIMSAYASYDGVPAVSNKHTLTDILRGEWGYEYYVTSDAGGTDRLCTAFAMCESSPIDSQAIVKYALPAGNDVEMGGGSYNFETIPALIADGGLSTADLDRAVARELRAKFDAGLFENPFPGVAAAEFAAHIHTDETVALARQLDAESIVLLENGEGLLPLRRDANIAVIGPMAHGYMNYGDYVPYLSQWRGVTPFDGISAAGTGKVTFTQGCERWSNDDAGFADAVAAAQAADVAVVVVGTWSRDQTELWAGLNATTGEHVDASGLGLVGAMPRLAAAVIATGKPTVVVLSSGKPVAEPWLSSAAGALVQQFYPSEQGGHALADVLFGDADPGGRLAVSFPRSVGTAPAYYDYLNSARTADPGYVTANGSLVFGHAYVLDSPAPLYAFGHGLSYASFRYGALGLSSAEAAAGDTVTAEVDVTNESGRDGSEVVQLYVKDLIASVAVPNLQLRGFAKVAIPAGATRTVRIDLAVADLGLWDADMRYVVEPGAFAVCVGRASDDLRANATLTVVG